MDVDAAVAEAAQHRQIIKRALNIIEEGDAEEAGVAAVHEAQVVVVEDKIEQLKRARRDNDSNSNRGPGPGPLDEMEGLEGLIRPAVSRRTRMSNREGFEGLAPPVIA